MNDTVDRVSTFRCPDCGGTEFLEGPHGGLAINFACALCRARFNDTMMFVAREGKVEPNEWHLFNKKGFQPMGRLKEEK